MKVVGGRPMEMYVAARTLAESICNAVGTHYSDAGTPSPSASIGWAVFPEDGHDFETLLRAADERMPEP